MTGVKMEVTVDDGDVRAAAQRIATFSDARGHALYDAVGAAMVAKTVLRFQTGEGPDGVWPPSQRVIKHGGKTLVLSGRLQGSQTHNVLQDGTEWGTNLIYAAVQQFGDQHTSYARSQKVFRKTAEGGKALKPGFVKKSKLDFSSWVTLPEYSVGIPARAYVGIDADDVAEMESLCALHLEAALLGTSVGSIQ